MTTPSFAGTWRLVDAFALTPDSRRVASPLGHRVLGQIMYDDAGTMSAQLMAAARRDLAGLESREHEEVVHDAGEARRLL